jgi:hypothetical protein
VLPHLRLGTLGAGHISVAGILINVAGATFALVCNLYHVRKHAEWDKWQQKGVVTLSQIERNSPISVNVEARDFNDLVYRSIAKIRLVSPNVTTPPDGCSASTDYES